MTEWKMKSTALLLDPDGKAGQAYGAKNTPHMFVINPEGKVIYAGAIDSKATPNPADIPSLDQLRESRARRIAGRQTGHNAQLAALRLLGEVSIAATSLLKSATPAARAASA